jgi:DNA helicase-2/ATP-dependent DNA helicase PcrA
MQRIYLDGKENLPALIPTEWERPAKIMNHRSRKRIVKLCNSIRSSVDGIEQESRHDKSGGFVRVFIINNNDPLQAEKSICIRMAAETDDNEWQKPQSIKCLTVEHQMAAKRLGFNSFLEPLNSINSYKQGLMNGSLSVIGVLTRVALPLYEAYITNNQFEIMRIVREYSLIFSDKKGQLSSSDIVDLRRKINTLTRLWDNNDPKCIDLIKCIYEENLFSVHDDIKLLINRTASDGVEDPETAKLDSLASSLVAPFSEVKRYQEYMDGNASFDTHQGVKGLEFPRVMVIIDDSSTRGSSFNYNKLFGIEKKSDTDIRNETEGRETTIERTKRLLYVTCSRAIDSLAIVYYTTDIATATEAISSSGWFEENEIISL